jgi:hypothetical protein
MLARGITNKNGMDEFGQLWRGLELCFPLVGIGPIGLRRQLKADEVGNLSTWE